MVKEYAIMQFPCVMFKFLFDRPDARVSRKDKRRDEEMRITLRYNIRVLMS